MRLYVFEHFGARILTNTTTLSATGQQTAQAKKIFCVISDGLEPVTT